MEEYSAPDPVSDLAIVVRPNGTGLISWKPSADAQNILFYQVVFYALSNEFGCQTRKETVNVRAVGVTTNSPHLIHSPTLAISGSHPSGGELLGSAVRVRGASDQLRPDRTGRRRRGAGADRPVAADPL